MSGEMTPRECPRCGRQNDSALRFCGGCGLALRIVCASCATENPPAHRFCGQCGAPLPAVGGRDEPPTQTGGRRPAEPERRNVTLLFCDLVGSTSLAQALDPEDLREVLLSYRNACIRVVTAYGGAVMRFVGDGLLACFGYPRAQDRDPVNAVLAGLEIVRAVRAVPVKRVAAPSPELAVHIGIHTGLAVIGGLGEGEAVERDAVVGEAPNVAARIEQAAPPNTVLLSEATHALVRGAIECRDLGPFELKGLGRPVTLFEAVGERRLDAVLTGDDVVPGAPLIGRDRELELLRARWTDVVSGSGSAVLIVGEAGIGKTRLVSAFMRSISADVPIAAVMGCAPHAIGTALFPVSRWLRRELALGRDDDAATTAGAVGRFVASIHDPPADAAETTALLGAVLALPETRGDVLARMAPQRRRERTMELIVEWLRRQSEIRPLAIVIEDLHWSDATTLDFIALLVDQLPTMRAALIATTRPEFAPTWAVRSHVDRLALGPISLAQTEELIKAIGGPRTLPQDLVSRVAQRAGGIPLFAEEMAKVLVGAGRADGPDAPGAIAIPGTLQDLLTARIDRLGPARPVAQLAAVLGVEFSYRLIRSIDDSSEEHLLRALRTLVDAEIVQQRGFPPAATYVFRHALLHEAAYQSLLIARRRQLHEKTFDVLRRDFPEIVAEHPEIAALHAELAGRQREALSLWHASARRALDQSAAAEAIAHLDRAALLLATVDDENERRRIEIEILVDRGSALIAAEGYAAPSVRETYERARALCERVDQPAQLAVVLRGLQSYFQVRGPLDVAYALSVQVLDLAEQSGERIPLVQAHRRLGWCLFCRGEVEAGRGHLRRALELYEPDQAREHIRLFGSDAGVMGLVNLAWVDCCAGDQRAAAADLARALGLARELRHPLTLAYCLCVSAAVQQALGAVEECERLARETVELAEKAGFLYWAALGRCLSDWAASSVEPSADRISAIEDGLRAYRATGGELFAPYILTLLAEVSLLAGAVERGLVFADQGLASSEEAQIWFQIPDLHRVRAELLLALGRPVAEIADALRRTIRIAEEQGAQAAARRARTALARLGAAAERIAPHAQAGEG